MLTSLGCPLIPYLAFQSFQVLSSHLVFPLEARSLLITARGEARLPRKDNAFQIRGLPDGARWGATEVRWAAEAAVSTEELQRRKSRLVGKMQAGAWPILRPCVGGRSFIKGLSSFLTGQGAATTTQDPEPHVEAVCWGADRFCPFYYL